MKTNKKANNENLKEKRKGQRNRKKKKINK